MHRCMWVSYDLYFLICLINPTHKKLTTFNIINKWVYSRTEKRLSLVKFWKLVPNASDVDGCQNVNLKIYRSNHFFFVLFSYNCHVLGEKEGKMLENWRANKAMYTKFKEWRQNFALFMLKYDKFYFGLIWDKLRYLCEIFWNICDL